MPKARTRKHEFELDTLTTPHLGKLLARCSCGWFAAGCCTYEATARREHEKHVRRAYAGAARLPS